MKRKINLAVIFCGAKDQLTANRAQFRDLKNNLTDFNVIKYYFNSKGKNNLLNDFKNNKIDVVLKNAYGRGHETDIENFLGKYKIPFLGSAAKSVYLGTNKHLSKEIFKKFGLPLAKDVYINKANWRKNKNKLIKKINDGIGYPCLVKDVGGTDSRGIKLAISQKNLKIFLKRAVKKFAGIIVEEYINKDYEVTCLAVGNNKPIACEPVALVSMSKIINGEIKDQGVVMKIPAKLPKKIINQIKKITVLAHKALSCRTFSRADILIKNNKLYLLEVDVHPGFRSVSPTVLSAKYGGLSMNDLFLKFYKLINL